MCHHGMFYDEYHLSKETGDNARTPGGNGTMLTLLEAMVQCSHPWRQWYDAHTPEATMFYVDVIYYFQKTKLSTKKNNINTFNKL